MEGTVQSSIIAKTGYNNISYNHQTAITTKLAAGKRGVISKASLLVDTPSPSPPRTAKRSFVTRFNPYEAKRALLTPTGAGGFNLLRPIETCIDRMSPTPTDIRRFPRRLYGSSSFVSGGSGVNANTKTVPVLPSALRHPTNRMGQRSHVTFSMADDNRRRAFQAEMGLMRQPQRSLTSPAELRLLAVHDGRSMAYR